MKYKVVISDPAKAEFKEIHAYLTHRFGKKSAFVFKTTFRTLIKSLAKHPFQFPPIVEIPGIRKCAALSPTILFYEVVQQQVIIHRLRDGRQFSEIS